MKETFEFGISVKGEQKRRQEVKGLAMNSFHMLTHVAICSAVVATDSQFRQSTSVALLTNKYEGNSISKL
jgi:hypothetical protein